MRHLRLYILIYIVFCCSRSYGQTTFVKHFNTKDGLPSNSCYYTLQDKKGYIWVATDAGVCRFDGKVFETFSIDDGLPDNQVIKLHEDHKGRIWMSALNGQLSYFYNGKIFNERNDTALKLLNFKSIVISFFEDSKGNMWFGTNKNLLVKWNGKSIIKYVSGNNSSQFISTVMYEDKAERLWALSANAHHLYKGNTFVNFKQPTGLLSFKTTLHRQDKTLLLLTENGLSLREGDRQKLTLPVDTALLSNNPGYFFADNHEGLWLANNAGVSFIDRHGHRIQYLSNVQTTQVIRDIKGNMWFTTNNGIYMLPEKSKRIYMVDQTHGLSNNGIKSLMKDRYNRLWMGMDHGTINILSRPGYTVSCVNLPGNRFSAIKQMAVDSSGKKVFFSSDYELGILDISGKSTGNPRYLRELNNSNFVLKNFSISKNNQLALALSSGIVVLEQPMSNFSFSAAAYKEGENFFSGRSYRVYYDQSGHLWFSNTAGFSEFSNRKTHHFLQESGILNTRINDMKALQDGTMVLATDGYGVLFFRNGKIVKQITTENGLASNICKKLFTQEGYVWVVTNIAVNRILLKDQYPVESFDFTNSMLDNDVNEVYADNDTAFFATNHGLVYFANNPFDRSQEVPKVLISAVFNNKKMIDLNTSMVFAPADNNITFFYSAIDFQNNNISYRYRLNPNSGWTETKSRRLEFSSLEPDSYTFELCARTSNSQWSKPVSVSFVLKEHFWQSLWFMALILLLASFSFYKIAVIVTKQQKDKDQQRLLLKNRILMLEQQALQAMMNPHFVFNVMNSIQHYINTKNTSSANKILTGFARLIRKNLDICTKSFISLEEEIEYLTLYLSLEKMRFGEKFNYTLSIANDIDQDETMIPSMILQPYIENAIWHGLMPKEEGGNLAIVINHQSADSLLIQITDDGIGIDNSLRIKNEKHNSKGMSLTQERVNLINQIESDPIQIRIHQNGNSGTTISIIIPNR
ncbi:histidine kinase [Pedobacter sp. MC2016-15]|uniref:sensor histidine kinase n=1 Tax=Pedobacter sp. MC2016-15 TaxID=2994473 RepID=UPI002247E613|nr:two-component regulator propeller domain-containing protein [Pedobacter sp. MC2016-15]MCX2480374.1 histidine kinase [Pedobacter sp. MC2016-15]